MLSIGGTVEAKRIGDLGQALEHHRAGKLDDAAAVALDVMLTNDDEPATSITGS